MDRFGHSAPSLDELKQIQNEARASNSLKQLRVYFDRVQELRRIHSGDFDIQLVVAETQEEVIQRARDLRTRTGNSGSEEELFGRTNHHPRPVEAVEEETSDTPEHPESISWRRATILAMVLTAAICIVFFYLIQAARRINLEPPAPKPAAQSTDQTKVPVQNAKATDATRSSAPVVRLYTDLIPGTVSIDDGEPQDLKDGELNLDHLEPGRHSMKVAGRSGTAEFSFDVANGAAPQVTGPVTASNAMAVTISAQNGQGHLLTSVQQPDIALDGKPAGQAGPDGLALDNLGNTDHELQVAQANDRQRFVLTYSAAPVLTVYVKSDPNAGTVTVLTQQDGVSIFIDDKPYRRTTDHGQIRIPLKVGGYVIKVHKDGFVDPPPQSVDVKKGEESELSFDLQPIQNLASLEIRDATPGTVVSVDKAQVATVGSDGIATAGNLTSGDHSVELGLPGSIPKKFERAFQGGKTVMISGGDSTLEKAQNAKTATEQPATTPTPEEKAAPVAKPLDLPGEQVRRGGGFVHYNTPKSSGHYSFQAHSKIGGFLKHDKLQWYAGYENSENYVLFSLDGKHATVREMKDGKSIEIKRVPFDANSDEWVQVSLSVKPDSIGARIKTTGGDWIDMGSVPSDGRDFTQDKVGFYVPGNDEIAVSNFRFTNN